MRVLVLSRAEPLPPIRPCRRCRSIQGRGGSPAGIGRRNPPIRRPRVSHAANQSFPSHSQPVKLWFVYLSLCLALVLDLVPTGRLPGVPDWLALVLAFWCVREPLRVGMGTGFLFGLLVDVGHGGAAMGQHAAGLCTSRLRCQRAVPTGVVVPAGRAGPAYHACCCSQVLMVLVRLVAGAEFPGGGTLSARSSAPCCGCRCTSLLCPQYRPADRDDNRPI